MTDPTTRYPAPGRARRGSARRAAPAPAGGRPPPSTPTRRPRGTRDARRRLAAGSPAATAGHRRAPPRADARAAWTPPVRTEGSRWPAVVFGCHPGRRRAVVLRRADARPGPADDPLEPALAAHPHRHRRARPVRLAPAAVALSDGRASATGARRRVADRSPDAGRLASPRRGAVRRGPGDGRDRPGRRPRPLAGGPRAAVPRAPAVAGPARASAPRSGPATSTYDPALRFEVAARSRRRRRIPARRPLALPEQRRRHARVRPDRRRSGCRFPAASDASRVYWLRGYAGGLFIPFRDATNGTRPTAPAATSRRGQERRPRRATRRPASSILDCNFAYQPSCAFDPRWACPLAPPENRLDLAVEAGERLA